MKKFLLTLTAFALLAGFAISEEKEGGSKSEKKAKGGKAGATLKGGYTIVSGEKDGEKEPADRIKGTTVFFDEAKVVIRSKDKELYSAEYKIDSSEKPWKITMTSDAPGKHKTVHGLIEKDGDTVKIIYDLDGSHPKDFKSTKKGENYFVLKNENKMGDKMKDKK